MLVVGMGEGQNFLAFPETASPVPLSPEEGLSFDEFPTTKDVEECTLPLGWQCLCVCGPNVPACLGSGALDRKKPLLTLAPRGR